MFCIYSLRTLRKKVETMDPITQTIHFFRSKYDNEVSFVIGGDTNKTDYSNVIDSYGALKQYVTVGTRNKATLEIILSDLFHLYHAPTTLNPLQVDENKTGSDSNRKIFVFAPKSNLNFKLERNKISIKINQYKTQKYLFLQVKFSNKVGEMCCFNLIWI